MRHHPRSLLIFCLTLTLSLLLTHSNASASIIPSIRKSSITSPQSSHLNLLSLARNLGLGSRRDQSPQQQSQRARERNQSQASRGLQSKVAHSQSQVEKRQVPPNLGDGVPNNDTSLSGTWSSGAAHVVTGLGFYDPGTLSFTFPQTAGQCYSFTDDGFWEQALFIYTPNPAKPSCPQAQLIWQHGTYTLNSNNTLTLNPIEGDGQQMIVDRCSQSSTSVQPYNQKEDMNGFEIHQMIHYRTSVWGLQLYQFDGTPKPLLYQIYNPPQMLPTEQLHKTIIGGLSPST